MQTAGDRGCFAKSAGAPSAAVRARRTGWRPAVVILVGAVLATPGGFVSPRASAQEAGHFQEYPVAGGSHPHDVAPTADGSVWYTAQVAGAVGRLDPRTGKISLVPLGEGSAPHGIIAGPDHALWVTDGGANAIVRIAPGTGQVRRFPLPASRGSANLNTETFDPRGNLWFTGQSGVYGRVALPSGRVDVWDAPRGNGPYGITTTRQGLTFYASLAGNYVGRIDTATGTATVLQPPTPEQGARRVWSDSHGRVWMSEWNAGKVARYDPATGRWKEWKLPGSHPMAYAVYVDDHDMVWLSDWGANALVRFDPAHERFQAYPYPTEGASVRQIAGRPGEVWAAESGPNKLVVWRER
jgi:virginiamycin B lyase